MRLATTVGGVLTFFSILTLLLGGGWIAIRSGVGQPRSGRDDLLLVTNFLQVMLRVAGYLAFFLIVQRLIGLGPVRVW